MGINMKDMLATFSGRTKRRKMRVDEAMDYLIQEEEDALSTWTPSRGRPSIG